MTTRRSFLKLAVSCSLTGSLLARAAEHRLNIGVGTYSYHLLSMDDMIVQLRLQRIKEIEMSRVEFMLLSHPKDEIFHLARQKLNVAGIRCVSYYAATIQQEQEVEDAIRFAKLLGSRNVTGDANGPILNHIDRRFTEEGLTFSIHNHYFKYKFAYESSEDVLRALAPLSSTMGATADVGHFASCGYDPVESLRKLAPRLRLVHLKDVQASGGEVNVLLGRGVSNIPGVMKELRRQKFSGLVAVEYEKEGPVEDDMKKEIAYARSLA